MVICAVVWLYIPISQTGILCSNEHALALLKETGLFEVYVNQEVNLRWLVVYWGYVPSEKIMTGSKKGVGQSGTGLRSLVHSGAFYECPFYY